MTFNRPRLAWRAGERTFALGSRTFVMGIVNVTPDSFSDGGNYADTAAAIAHGQALAAAGADLLDIGGESTRPGAPAVSAASELERVLPVIEALAATDLPISIDTTKAEVAAAAIEAGASIVNDVSAGTIDPEIPELVAKTGVGYVIMHMQGSPRTMQKNPDYSDAVGDIRAYLAERMKALATAGIAAEQLVLDPGIGFGKTLDHNLELLAGLPAFAELGRPLLIGLSRKSMLGQITGREVDQRLAGSLAGLSASILNGAHILRVHDMAESRDAADVIDAILNAGQAAGAPASAPRQEAC